MIRNCIYKIFLFALILTITNQTPAQQVKKKDPQESRYILKRINGKVKLDGLCDEEAWKGIKPLPLIMHTPDFGKTPTEKTEIFIAYDNEYLYVAGRLYDREPSKIMASSKKRDDLAPTNDWFGVVIDTFNDKENGLCFFTSPTGLRLDMTVANDAQTDSPDGVPMNISWNTFWDVVTVRNERGWFAEFRIPFSSLRFQDKDGDVVMGLIAWRWIARKNETIIFPAFPPNWNWSMFKPSQAKEIVLSGIQSRKPLYIAPYILGGYGQTFDLNDQETAYQKTNDPVFEAGLDIKYGLTSNLTLDISLNTDFAQVEADDQQVNLTRFSLFFPEKRLFFQERSSTFDFSFGGPNRLFYSRQIGIYDETPVRIYGGVRLIGRVGAWDLGLMSMQTAPVKDEDLPSENFVVARLRRRVFNPFSYVGGIVTSRIGMDGTYNVAYGLDGIFRLFGDDYLKINWAQTFEDDKKNKLFSLEPARLTVGWQRRNIKGFSYDLSYSYCGELYNPEMGFEIRENYTHFGNRIQYGWIPGENAKLMNHNIFLQGFVFISNDDKSVESLEIGPGWSYSTKVGAFGNINFKYFYEDVSEGFLFYEEDDEDEEPEDPDVPVGQYRFFGLDATYATPWNRQVAFLTNLYAGTFYDGWRTSLSLIPRWCISSSFELSGTYQFNWIKFPDRNKEFYIHIARLRILYMLNTKFSASAFIQYNSLANAVITNVRLRFNPREGNDLYFVYNEGLNTNRFREVPNLPYTSDRTIMMKYTYTFNL